MKLTDQNVSEKRVIQLTQGMVAIVDSDDYEKVRDFKWCAVKFGRVTKIYYAATNCGRTFMHHIIFGKPQNGLVTDHINGNGLDNRKINLRHVTNRENSLNKHNVNRSSRYQGISLDKRYNSWIARIKLNGKDVYLGSYKTDEEAHKAYSDACYKYFNINCSDLVHRP